MSKVICSHAEECSIVGCEHEKEHDFDEIFCTPDCTYMGKTKCVSVEKEVVIFSCELPDIKISLKPDADMLEVHSCDYSQFYGYLPLSIMKLPKESQENVYSSIGHIWENAEECGKKLGENKTLDNLHRVLKVGKYA